MSHVNAPPPPQVNRSTSQVDCQVTGLALDELELASLRGTVQDAALHVNFDTRMGRGNLKVAGPRFSGLQVTLVPPAPDHTIQNATFAAALCRCGSLLPLLRLFLQPSDWMQHMTRECSPGCRGRRWRGHSAGNATWCAWRRSAWSRSAPPTRCAAATLHPAAVMFQKLHNSIARCCNPGCRPGCQAPAAP